MRTYLIALLLFLGGAELTLRLIKPASYYPDSYSRIWGLYEKKRHMYGGIPYYLRHFTFIRKELPPLPSHDDRVDYYCKLRGVTPIPNATPLSHYKKGKEKWYYYYDLYEYLRYFPLTASFLYRFGDVTEVMDYPTLVKSRPIGEDNANNVLMPLDKGRHLVFVNDKLRFQDKRPLLVFRGGAYQEHRAAFIRQFKDHPLCNVADTQRRVPPEHQNGNGYMSTEEQLHYKFILSLEGYDVATNLKWILSSNSLCFATKHRYETWFMEGRLIPNYHYVLIKDDYSDLIEKITYYTEHEEEALAIIAHAHEHVRPFLDKKHEDEVALLVLKTYFEKTERIERDSNPQPPGPKPGTLSD